MEELLTNFKLPVETPKELVTFVDEMLIFSSSTNTPKDEIKDIIPDIPDNLMTHSLCGQNHVFNVKGIAGIPLPLYDLHEYEFKCFSFST